MTIKLLALKVWQGLLGGAVMVAQPTVVPSGPSVDEVLAYTCARKVAERLESTSQVGPMFSVGDLAFTSIEDSKQDPMLVLSSGGGMFAVSLPGHGVVRIRLSLPDGHGRQTMYYLKYLHGGILSRSRIFEFSANRAPVGKDDLDYLQVQPARVSGLLAHWNYAIFETAERLVKSILEQRIVADQIHDSNDKSNCAEMARTQPELAKGLEHNLNSVELLTMGPIQLSGKRQPASE